MRHCLRAGQGQCCLSDGTLSSAALGEANFIRCTSGCPICISKRMMNEGEKGQNADNSEWEIWKETSISESFVFVPFSLHEREYKDWYKFSLFFTDSYTPCAC